VSADGFLVAYGPRPTITHTACRRETAMTSDPATGDVGSDEIAHYKRTHKCGPADGLWDIVEDGPEEAWQS
jgi:hypothetical protein